MAQIVAVLRQYGSAATNDVFEGVTYWTEDQLEEVADRSGRRGMVKLKTVSPDNKTYRLVVPKGIQLENTAVIYANGSTINPAPVTYMPNTNEFVFTSSQPLDEYWVHAFAVNMNEALAELWHLKAMQRFNYIDWKAQNNRMNMHQEYAHCVERSEYYRNKTIRTFDRMGRGSWFF